MNRDLFDLSGRVAVVTGGSRGIGRAIAFTLAGAGADVVIASRKLPNCETVAAEIRSATGRRALPVAFHAGRWDDAERLADAVYHQFGRCDVLVNNAGGSPLYPALTDITEDYYDKVHSLNAKGPFRLSALVGSRMAAGEGGTRSGSIINISSVVSLRPNGQSLIYAAAKAALNAFTVGLADAYGPAVRANCVLAGGVDTDIAKAWSPEKRAELSRTPLGRIGVPDDFAGVTLWLASDASAWVTGEMIRVDGGRYRQTV
jgi:NAD(P)-dependent dehydrogenase (short-subunit alcohol dehydrogenase family)